MSGTKEKLTPPPGFGEEVVEKEEYKVPPSVEPAGTIAQLLKLLENAEDRKKKVYIDVEEEGYVVITGSVYHCGEFHLKGYLEK